ELAVELRVAAKARAEMLRQRVHEPEACVVAREQMLWAGIAQADDDLERSAGHDSKSSAGEKEGEGGLVRPPVAIATPDDRRCGRPGAASLLLAALRGLRRRRSARSRRSCSSGRGGLG